MDYDNIIVKDLAGKEVTLFFLGKPCLGNLVDVVIESTILKPTYSTFPKEEKESEI